MQPALRERDVRDEELVRTPDALLVVVHLHGIAVTLAKAAQRTLRVDVTGSSGRPDEVLGAKHDRFRGLRCEHSANGRRHPMWKRPNCEGERPLWRSASFGVDRSAECPTHSPPNYAVHDVNRVRSEHTG